MDLDKAVTKYLGTYVYGQLNDTYTVFEVVNVFQVTIRFLNYFNEPEFETQLKFVLKAVCPATGEIVNVSEDAFAQLDTVTDLAKDWEK